MLLSRTIPELRQRVARLGFTLAEINLRWSLTEEQIPDSNLVSLCLDQVERGQRRDALLSLSISASYCIGRIDCYSIDSTSTRKTELC
jgi:hypothetical protein